MNSRNDHPFTIAVACNNESILQRNLMCSPDLRDGHPHQIIVRRDQPSAAIAHNGAIDSALHDVIVLVHQDVYFPAGWFAGLASSIRWLDDRGVSWGALGSFGSSGTVRGGVGRVYTTGKGIHGAPATVPTRIETLDEIVLVVRRSTGLRFDTGLPSFHLYGADLCLEAEVLGLQNFALPGFCVHNTNQLLRLPPEFVHCYRYMKRKWIHRLPIHTSCITISRFDHELTKRSVQDLRARLMRDVRQPLHRVDDPRSLLPGSRRPVPEALSLRE